MRRNFNKTLRGLLLGAGLVLLCISFAYVWVNYYNDFIRIPFYRRGNYMLTILYSIIYLVFIFGMKGHQISDRKLAEIIISQCISITAVNVIMYFPLSLLQYELLRPLPLILLTFAQWFGLGIWSVIANRIYFKVVPPTKLLHVVDDAYAGNIEQRLLSAPKQYALCGTVKADDAKELLLADLNAYDAIFLSVEAGEWRNELTGFCFANGIKIILQPNLMDVILATAKRKHPIDTLLLSSRIHGLSTEERSIKRVVDIIGSIFAILITSPLLLLSALAVKLCDGGPVLFWQERLTRDGKRFKLCKFRSMCVDAEQNGQQWAIENDPRITSVGKILRKLRIDELPQFFNVLKGDMSIVGPRPECPDLAEKFTEEMPAFQYRLKVKAGITGYAQVYGNYATAPKDKLLMDMLYIEDYSFSLDITLLLLTFRTLLMTEKTRGKKNSDDSVAKTEDGYDASL